MHHKERFRIGLGLALAAVVAVFGPVFEAVANHSGNQAGEQPFASTAVHDRQGASLETTIGGESYRFYVWTDSMGEGYVGSGLAGARHESFGEAVFIQRDCGLDGCDETTWRGPANPLHTSEYVQHPALMDARYDGVLTSGDRSCRVEAVLKANGRFLADQASYEVPHVNTLSGGALMSRDATGTITSSCFEGTIEARGKIWTTRHAESGI